MGGVASKGSGWSGLHLHSVQSGDVMVTRLPGFELGGLLPAARAAAVSAAVAAATLTTVAAAVACVCLYMCVLPPVDSYVTARVFCVILVWSCCSCCCYCWQEQPPNAPCLHLLAFAAAAVELCCGPCVGPVHALYVCLPAVSRRVALCC